MFNFLKFFRRSPEIVPFKASYSMYYMLDAKQQKSYKYIYDQILNNKKVNIEGNLSYLYVFLFESSKELLSGCDYKKIIHKLQLLTQLYSSEDEVFKHYCEETTADIYFCFGEFDKYFDIMSKYVTGKYTYSTSANIILNIKYKLNREVNAQELLCISNKLTKYGKEKIDEVIDVMNTLIRENLKYSQETIINKIAAIELEKCKNYTLSLFCGNPYGYELNKHLIKDCYHKNFVCFYANREFLDIIEEMSRVSENIVRESNGLPRVNEGWINEVKLYYSIKEKFKDFNVIHQYRANWLGQQSLDIFIIELNLGIEYQGLQHYQPVDFFGGKEGFRKTVQRDKKKKSLCEKNNVELICVNEDYNVDEVFDKINSLIKNNTLL